MTVNAAYLYFGNDISCWCTAYQRNWFVLLLGLRRHNIDKIEVHYGQCDPFQGGFPS